MKRVGLAILSMLAVAAAYAWFVDEAIVPEAIAALLTGAVVVAALSWIEHAAPMRATFSAKAVRPFLSRVLPGIIRENAELLGPILWRTLVRREALRGRWIELRYAPGRIDDAVERGRRATVIFGSNLTPNALPLCLDSHDGRFVLHQLIARREAAAADPLYPM